MNIQRLIFAAITSILVFTMSGCFGPSSKASLEARFRAQAQSEWDGQSTERQSLACDAFRARPEGFIRDASEFLLDKVASDGTAEEKRVLTPAFVETNMKAFFVDKCDVSGGS